MKPEQFIDILHTAEHLKNTTRHSWTSCGNHESVAEHSWRLCLMAYFLQDEFPEADMDRVLKMCLIHDLGEAFTGDIPSFWKTDADEDREETLLSEWVDSLPPPYREQMQSLFAEMEANQTQEAKIFRALDNLEAVVQHNEAPLSTWIPLEHEMNLTYGAERCEFSPYLRELRAVLREQSIQKLKSE